MKKQSRQRTSRSGSSRSHGLASLSKVGPAILVQSPSDKVGLFFLMLSVISNDMKDITDILLSIQEDQKRASGLDKEQLKGRQTMIIRLVAGLLHELLNFLEKEKKTLLEKEFIAILQQFARRAGDSMEDVCGHGSR